jgi:hypothetical protein
MLQALERREIHTICVAKPEGKGSLEKLRRRWEDDISWRLGK